VSRRSYDQYCAAARALDVVGERWTLLIVRELLLGPRRYTDLRHGLPGIGEGLLAARLKALEAEGLVGRRRLFPPASSVVYELTDAGRELEPVLDGLARWGARWLGEPTEAEAIRPRWVMLAMKTRFDAEAARGVNETYEFMLDDDPFHVRVEDGTVEVEDGTARGAALHVGGETRAFLEAAMQPERAGDLVAAGRLYVEGEPDALVRCRAIFAPALPAPADARAA
jgi:DNA-binding HxlR family transcriptional regulator